LAFFFFRTATKVSEMLGNVNTSSALSAFEKMEEKGTLFMPDIFQTDLFLLLLKLPCSCFLGVCDTLILVRPEVMLYTEHI
jgi:hypothetical protein